MTKPDNLHKILIDHRLWLKDRSKGKRAELSYVDLRKAKLGNANFRGADLREAII